MLDACDYAYLQGYTLKRNLNKICTKGLSLHLINTTATGCSGGRGQEVEIWEILVIMISQ